MRGLPSQSLKRAIWDLADGSVSKTGEPIRENRIRIGTQYRDPYYEDFNSRKS